MGLLLTQIDELVRGDHYHLTVDDECFALREYTPRAGFSYSETNQLISNFKKSVDRKGKPEWYYKEVAIEKLATELRVSTNPKWLKGAVIVPIPPSKSKSNPLYDDRLVQVANLLCEELGEVRELLVQDCDTEAHHQQDQRRDVDRLKKILKIDESLTSPAPDKIGLLDDMLTTGAHFCAAKHVISQRFPGVRVTGLFLARRIIVNEDTSDLDEFFQ